MKLSQFIAKAIEFFKTLLFDIVKSVFESNELKAFLTQASTIIKEEVANGELMTQPGPEKARIVALNIANRLKTAGIQYQDNWINLGIEIIVEHFKQLEKKTA